MMRLVKTAFRSLWKFRLYTIVNIIGLAVSLGCVILIARYVHQETTVNHFAEDLDRTYITMIEEVNGQSRYGGIVEGFSDLLGDPSIEKKSSFIAIEEDFIQFDGHKINVKVLAADSVFLEILPYPIQFGSGIMTTPDDVILSLQLARKLFGDENPVGKTITYSSGDALKIVGVLGEPSSKSFLDFDLLLNKDQRQFRARVSYDLVMLYHGSDANQLNSRYSDYVKNPGIAGREGRYQLAPLKDFYFDLSHAIPIGISAGVVDSVFVRGNSVPVYVLSVVGVLILLVGLFNFINIYTVVMLKRGREFGIQKIFGAGRRWIFRQIYFENLVMALLALFGAWFFIEVASPLMAERLAFVVMPNLRFDIWLSLIVLIGLPVVTSLHPFLRYSYSLPVSSLRSVKAGGLSIVSRAAFLFLQYVITFGLFVAALFFMKQLDFMLNADTGYNTRNVVISRILQRNFNMPLSTDFEDYFSKIYQQVALIERRMDESPLFSEWQFGKPVYDLQATTGARVVGDDDFQSVKMISLSPAYLKMFGFQLKEGRLWDASDGDEQNRCILNESAKKLFGIEDIHDVKLELEYIVMSERPEDRDEPPYEIVGVINDFQNGHLSKQTVPLMIKYQEKGFHFDHLMARFVDGRKEDALAYLGALYKEINNSTDFTYSLLDEEIASLYEDDRRISRVYVIFAVIAIFVSCLGLFALSLFDIRQRYREIALRKVNGARTIDVLWMLLKKYMLLLAFAFVVAVPVAYLFIHRYLEGFATKTPISWWLFVVPALVVAGVSLLTLVWQVKRAARINPAEVLNGE